MIESLAILLAQAAVSEWHTLAMGGAAVLFWMRIEHRLTRIETLFTSCRYCRRDAAAKPPPTDT